MLKNLVECMAKALVDNSDAVSVKETEGENSSVLELSVAKEDLGKVIGREGRNVNAMRTILSGVSAKLHKRAILEVIE